MKIEPVEVYSDKTNCPVIRHPEREFPGVLNQGDNLYSLCTQMDALCASLRAEQSDRHAAANRVRNALWSHLMHYKQVLAEHAIPLPFSETPPPE